MDSGQGGVREGRLAAPENPQAARLSRSLEAHGLLHTGPVYWNLSVPRLVEMALARGEGFLAPGGALVVRTDPFTGRTPKDKFTVDEPSTREKIWWGPVNRPFEGAKFDRLLERVRAYLQGRELFVFDGWVCADESYRMPIRVITEKAWHSLFARTLFLRPGAQELQAHRPEFTIINACDMRALPSVDGTRSEAFIIVSFEKKLALLGGTRYAGEMKKSVFFILNYLLPEKGVFPMHCSANMGRDGGTALFFGLSGTGKTTLSADPNRRLIGDDEHGWSKEGIFNFEGGCYAKTIRLTREGEPQIYDAIRFGSVLENVVVDPETRVVDYDEDSITENTRATYPVEYIENCVIPGVGGHPRNLFFLTCDAFGVLPPISLLTPEQAMYHFLLGYTAKVAGTEAGLTEPETTFSTCFGAPFLALSSTRYAQMLQEKTQAHGSRVWLVNTGWIGGGPGQVPRIKLSYTRALLSAALNGALEGVAYARDPLFGVKVPESCPELPSKVLKPENLWEDGLVYRRQARELALLFRKHFEPFASEAPQAVRAAGPVVP